MQLTGGGGAAKMNIDKVTAQLEELGRDYPFQVGTNSSLCSQSSVSIACVKQLPGYTY